MGNRRHVWICGHADAEKSAAAVRNHTPVRWYAGRMEQPKATITVTRRSPNDVRQRQIYVSLDGKDFAELLFGQTFTADVAAGTHRLRANNTLVWKTLDCDLEPGEHAKFSVVNRPGFGTYALLSLLGTGPIYLTFERDKG